MGDLQPKLYFSGKALECPQGGVLRHLSRSRQRILGGLILAAPGRFCCLGLIDADLTSAKVSLLLGSVCCICGKIRERLIHLLLKRESVVM